jgi:glutamate/aspartate transport system substrate-binding protein
VTRGTTNALHVQAFSDRQRLAINFLTGSDHKESFELVASGKAGAFANDDVLLYGLIADSGSSAQYRVTSDFISYDPYGLMYRKDDPEFAEVVARTFRRLAESREIVWIYEKWFLKQLQSGIRLNLPMGPQLEESFRVLGLPPNDGGCSLAVLKLLMSLLQWVHGYFDCKRLSELELTITPRCL